MAIHKAYAVHHTLAMRLMFLEGVKQTLNWHIEMGGTKKIEEYEGIYQSMLDDCTYQYRNEFTGDPSSNITPEMFAEAKRLHDLSADFNYSIGQRSEMEGLYSRIIRNRIKIAPNVELPSANTPQRAMPPVLPTSP